VILSRYRHVFTALRDSRLDIPGGSAVETDHRALRERALELYAPARWREECAAHALQLAEGLAGDLELVRDFANPWAYRLASAVTGLAAESIPALIPFAQAVFDAGASPGDPDAALLSANAAARLAGAFSSPADAPLHLQAFVALTVSLPAFLGNAFLALLRNPGEFGWVSEKTAVDELLRFAGPSVIQRRIARETFELLDLNLNAGQRVELRLAEANRDPREFPDPDRLDLRRLAAGHLAFGGGPHACVGAPLIRSAAAAILDAVAGRLPNFQLLSAERYGGPSIAGHRVRVHVEL
jgi:cytochrome P450